MTFDEKTHIYKIGEKVIPSVTTITSMLSSFVYKDIDPFILQRAADKGTLVHKAIEDYENFGEYELPEQYECYMTQYKKAKAVLGFEVIKREQKLHNNKYAGTIDCIGLYNDKKVLIDWKTTTIIHDKLVQPQLSAYKELAEFNGFEIEELYILQLTKTNYKMKKIEYNIDIFNNCYEIWEYMNKKEEINYIDLKTQFTNKIEIEDIDEMLKGE